VQRIEKMIARIVEHCAPTGERRMNAKAVEAQRASRVGRAVALRYE